MNGKQKCAILGEIKRSMHFYEMVYYAKYGFSQFWLSHFWTKACSWQWENSFGLCFEIVRHNCLML